jgi:flagellar FliJ protein
MIRSKRMAPVQRVVDDVERRQAAKMTATEQRALECEEKLAELERYRAEYVRGFEQRASTGMGAAGLRDYQAFLARLNEAIKQQQAVVERARRDSEVERKHWQDAAVRAKAIDHVVTQWQNEERRDSDRRDQRESDERAQRGARKE